MEPYLKSNTPFQWANTPKGRHVRVFISSTFLDMQEEREELVKNTFPMLRAQFKNHRINITEVDLRWGITSEETAEGNVLPICLAEIDYCRPYFIGLLGNYYGSKAEISSTTKKEYLWISDYKDSSITEIEIAYAIFSKNSFGERSFFYFRHPDFFPKIFPTESRQQLINEESRAKQNNLKRRICESNYIIRKNYPDPQALGQMVYNDLKKAIETDYPVEEIADELLLEAQDHAYFAENKLESYVPNQNNLQRLDNYLNEKGPPLCIVGGPGSGKTSLLASWRQHYKQVDPDHFVFDHYVSTVPKSTDHRALVNRLIGSLVRFFSLEFEPPEGEVSLVASLETAFMAIPHTETAVIVIDRLDLLEDKEHAMDLSWLPRKVPSNIKMVCSLRPGPILEVALNRGWQVFKIPSKSPGQIEQIAEVYLKNRRKRLSDIQLKCIAHSKQSADLLFLRTLLSELCLEAQFDTLNQKIEHYLTARDSETLFSLVIDRMERDFERNRPNLIEDSLRLLVIARRGLTEEELLHLLGTRETPLAMLYWVPVRQMIEEHLVDHSGVLSFSSTSFKNAVRQRYLPDKKSQVDSHLLLADYFQHQPLSPRKIDEYPWHLQEAGENDRLIEFLLDIPTFLAFPVENEQYKFELQRYWLSIEPHIDIVEAYMKSVEMLQTNTEADDYDFPSIYNQISLFFQLLGNPKGQVKASEMALIESEKLNGARHPDTALFINNLAHSLQHLGKNKDAKALYVRALTVLQHADMSETSLEGSIFDNLGQVEADPAAAERYFRQALSIREKVMGPKHPSTLRTMHNLSNTLVDKGQLHAAGELIRETLELREDILGINHIHTAITRASFAFLLFKQYRYDEAIGVAEKALVIFKKERGEGHPSWLSIINLIAVCYMRLHNLEAAEPLLMTFYNRILDLHMEQSLDGATAIHNLGNLLRLKGRLEEAKKHVARSIRIAQEIGGKEHLQLLIFENTLAGILFEQGKYQSAEHLYRSVLERRFRILGPQHIDTAQTLQDLGKLFTERGKLDEARSMLQQAFSIRLKALEKTNPAIRETQTLIENLQMREREVRH